MSMNYTGAPPVGGTPEDDDTPMFAPIPSWERGAKKRRGRGVRSEAPVAVATAPLAETRSFDSPLDAPLASGEVRTVYGESARTASSADEPLVPQPRVTARKRTGNAAPLAIAAGVVMIGGLAAAGWYASQPRDTGVAALTPGMSETSPAALDTASTSTLAANAAAPPAAPAAAATDVERPAVTPRATPTRTAAVRTRPAPSASATDAGVNASATLPAAPLPYAATVGPATDASATMPAAPIAAEPAPLAVTPVPETPPVVTPEPILTPGAASTPDATSATPAPDLGPTP